MYDDEYIGTVEAICYDTNPPCYEILRAPWMHNGKVVRPWGPDYIEAARVTLLYA